MLPNEVNSNRKDQTSENGLPKTLHVVHSLICDVYGKPPSPASYDESRQMNLSANLFIDRVTIKRSCSKMFGLLVEEPFSAIHFDAIEEEEKEKEEEVCFMNPNLLYEGYERMKECEMELSSIRSKLSNLCETFSRGAIINIDNNNNDERTSSSSLKNKKKKKEEKLSYESVPLRSIPLIERFKGPSLITLREYLDFVVKNKKDGEGEDSCIFNASMDVWESGFLNSFTATRSKKTYSYFKLFEVSESDRISFDQCLSRLSSVLNVPSEYDLLDHSEALKFLSFKMDVDKYQIRSCVSSPLQKSNSDLLLYFDVKIESNALLCSFLSGRNTMYPQIEDKSFFSKLDKEFFGSAAAAKRRALVSSNDHGDDDDDDDDNNEESNVDSSDISHYFRNRASYFSDWFSVVGYGDGNSLVTVRKDVWLMWTSGWLVHMDSRYPMYPQLIKHLKVSSGRYPCVDRMRTYNVLRKMLSWLHAMQENKLSQYMLSPDHVNFDETYSNIWKILDMWRYACNNNDGNSDNNDGIKAGSKVSSLKSLEDAVDFSYTNQKDPSLLKSLVAMILAKKHHVINREVVEELYDYVTGLKESKYEHPESTKDFGTVRRRRVIEDAHPNLVHVLATLLSHPTIGDLIAQKNSMKAIYSASPFNSSSSSKRKRGEEKKRNVESNKRRKVDKGGDGMESWSNCMSLTCYGKDIFCDGRSLGYEKMRLPRRSVSSGPQPIFIKPTAAIATATATAAAEKTCLNKFGKRSREESEDRFGMTYVALNYSERLLEEREGEESSYSSVSFTDYLKLDAETKRFLNVWEDRGCFSEFRTEKRRKMWNNLLKQEIGYVSALYKLFSREGGSRLKKAKKPNIWVKDSWMSPHLEDPSLISSFAAANATTIDTTTSAAAAAAANLEINPHYLEESSRDWLKLGSFLATRTLYATCSCDLFPLELKKKVFLAMGMADKEDCRKGCKPINEVTKRKKGSKERTKKFDLKRDEGKEQQGPAVTKSKNFNSKGNYTRIDYSPYCFKPSFFRDTNALAKSSIYSKYVERKRKEHVKSFMDWCNSDDNNNDNNNDNNKTGNNRTKRESESEKKKNTRKGKIEKKIEEEQTHVVQSWMWQDDVMFGDASEKEKMLLRIAKEASDDTVSETQRYFLAYVEYLHHTPGAFVSRPNKALDGKNKSPVNFPATLKRKKDGTPELPLTDFPTSSATLPKKRAATIAAAAAVAKSTSKKEVARKKEPTTMLKLGMDQAVLPYVPYYDSFSRHLLKKKCVAERNSDLSAFKGIDFNFLDSLFGARKSDEGGSSFRATTTKTERNLRDVEGFDDSMILLFFNERDQKRRKLNRRHVGIGGDLKSDFENLFWFPSMVFEYGCFSKVFPYFRPEIKFEGKYMAARKRAAMRASAEIAARSKKGCDSPSSSSPSVKELSAINGSPSAYVFLPPTSQEQYENFVVESTVNVAIETTVVVTVTEEKEDKEETEKELCGPLYGVSGLENLTQNELEELAEFVCSLSRTKTKYAFYSEKVDKRGISDRYNSQSQVMTISRYR